MDLKIEKQDILQRAPWKNTLINIKKIRASEEKFLYFYA